MLVNVEVLVLNKFYKILYLVIFWRLLQLLFEASGEKILENKEVIRAIEFV